MTFQTNPSRAASATAPAISFSSSAGSTGGFRHGSRERLRREGFVLHFLSHEGLLVGSAGHLGDERHLSGERLHRHRLGGGRAALEIGDRTTASGERCEANDGKGEKFD